MAATASESVFHTPTFDCTDPHKHNIVMSEQPKLSQVRVRPADDESSESYASNTDYDSNGSPKGTRVADSEADRQAVSSSTVTAAADASDCRKNHTYLSGSSSLWPSGSEDRKVAKMAFRDGDGDGDGDDDAEGDGEADGDGDGECDGDGDGDEGDGDGNEPSVKRKRRPRPPTGTRLQCAVCGDVAFGYNFDAVSCESCKAFFRRNAMRQHVCQNGNQCKIDKESRKYCSSCRLTKCLEVGMKRELILTPAKLEKRAKLVRKKHVHHSSSSLTGSQIQHSSTAHSVGGPPSTSGLPQFTSAESPSQLARSRKERFVSSISTASSSCAAVSQCDACECGLKHEHSEDGSFGGVDYSVNAPAAVAYAAAMLGSAARVGASHSFITPAMFAAGKPDLSAFAGTCPSDLLGLASSGHVPQRFYQEAVFAEMARLGLDVVAAVNAAASQQRCTGQLGTPSPQIKQDHSPSPSACMSRSPVSDYHALASMALPALNYEETIAKCTSACEQLLKPLNSNDLRHLRPANNAHEQFNYGEVFVRRFVIAFKQIPDFRSLGQAVQLKLLRSSMVSTLNIAGVFSFDVSRQAWVLQVENCDERVYPISDMIALFESSGQTHIRDYMRSYCEFHTRLRSEFGSDVLLFFVLILIDMFSPHRFTGDRDMLTILVPAHSRFVQFLEMYLVANYGSKQQPGSASLSSPHSAFGHAGFGKVLPGGPSGRPPRVGSPLEPLVKLKLDFCLDTLSNARTLEEYLAITSQYIGLTAMLPLLAEVCEYQLSLGADIE